ncbi:hypothetical protein BJ085DRAFT_33970 [Dimargaris cristalligena]|uniref:SAP domain-containing protein n=1 Tax=Dimargaris cristalligena TaxID=215637 RepID=A0A4P9ZT59_9FUNG|nr:hypothetical protein BJ085DRAFT_33970 [Dimargaris cristalligena]|eukprot:RKP36776.1 hypothetical protein BJ085DRAFT_33970 [Dimargaris cristalligena]
MSCTPLVPSEMKVVDLRKELAARNLSNKGLKKELVDRLEEAMQQDESPTDIPATGSPSPPASIPADSPPAQQQDESDTAVEVDRPAEPIAVATTAEPIPEKDASPTPVLAQTEPESESEPKSEPKAEPEAAIEEDKSAPPTQGSPVNSDESASTPVDQPIAEKTETMNVDIDEPEEPLKRKVSVASDAFIADKKARTDPEEIASESVPAGGKSTQVPPSRFDATTILCVRNLIRPYTLDQFLALFRPYGEITYSHLNIIKSHGFIQFTTIESATSAREGLYNQIFPKLSGRPLVLDFITEPRMMELMRDEASLISNGCSRPKIINVETGPDVPAEWYGLMVVNSKTGKPFVNQPEPKEAPAKPKAPVATEASPSPPSTGLGLDDLFSKTQTQPSLYFQRAVPLPLSPSHE